MPKRNSVLITTVDHKGFLWDVYEFRETSHGFLLAFGFPSDRKNRSGKRGIIPTAALVAHLDKHRWDRYARVSQVDLPIHPNVIKRLRKELGFHRGKDALEWYRQRFDDLQNMTGAEFTAKYGCSNESTSWARRKLGIRRCIKLKPRVKRDKE